MNHEMQKVFLYMILLIIEIIIITVLYKVNRKKQGLENYNRKYHDLIHIVIPKGAKDKLKAYALIKGFNNENELIAHLINEELRKDNELIKKS